MEARRGKPRSSPSCLCLWSSPSVSDDETPKRRSPKKPWWRLPFTIRFRHGKDSGEITPPGPSARLKKWFGGFGALSSHGAALIRGLKKQGGKLKMQLDERSSYNLFAKPDICSLALVVSRGGRRRYQVCPEPMLEAAVPSARGNLALHALHSPFLGTRGGQSQKLPCGPVELALSTLRNAQSDLTCLALHLLKEMANPTPAASPVIMASVISPPAPIVAPPMPPMPPAITAPAPPSQPSSHEQDSPRMSRQQAVPPPNKHAEQLSTEDKEACKTLLQKEVYVQVKEGSKQQVYIGVAPESEKRPWFHAQRSGTVSSRTRRLCRRLQRYAASQSANMRIGLAVKHLASGEECHIRGHESFPLASVAKLPIMVEAARQLQESEEKGGRLRLDTPLVLTESVKCIGAGRLYRQPSGTSITLGECMELMQVVSDNTAADMVLEVVTLPRVQRLMEKLSLQRTQIDLSQRQAYLVCLGRSPHFKKMNARQIADRWRQMSRAQRLLVAEATERSNQSVGFRAFHAMEVRSEKKMQKKQVVNAKAFLNDVRMATTVDNLGSPADMARLLGMLAQGELLSPQWSRHCMEILLRQRYGIRRLPKCLPSGTPVYHKTGTILGVCNDAGIIEIDDPRGRVVVVALVSPIRRKHEREAEAVIARMGRMVYNAYKSPAFD